MSDEWQYQVRIELADKLVDVARHDPLDPALGLLAQILSKHHATIRSQFDAFSDYVAEAERQGSEGYPLYKWTKATIEDPEKKAKHLKSFAIYVGENGLYPKGEADALEAELRPLVGGAVINRLSKHDSNPANNPQPPERYRA